MMQVQAGCRDCVKCMGSPVVVACRNAGRVLAGFSTVGVSEVALAFMAKCRGCGHQRSLHRAEEAGPQPTVQSRPTD